MSEVAELHVVVRGRVQGVGFRYAVVSYATSAGIDGWVRNRVDGSVEVAARGTAEDMVALRVFLDQGPRGARVDEVEELPAESGALGPGFQVRY